MKDYKKIPRITLWVLLGVGVIVSLIFFAGGSNGSLEVAGDFLDIPRFTDLFLLWNYFLVAAVVCVTVGVVCWEFSKTYQSDRKRAIRTLIVVGGFILVVLACWFAGSSEEMKIIGYEGSDNKGEMAKLSDAMIYLTYILVSATVGTVVWGWIYTSKKK